MLSCLGTGFETEFLPHFAAHYAGLGVPRDRIHVILHARDAGAPGLARAEAMARREGLAPTRRWIAPYTSETMWAERRALQRAVAGPADWVAHADIDEHHVYPARIADIVSHCRRWRVTAVQGPMVDRLDPGGALREVSADPALAAQFPVCADLSIALFGRRRGRGIGGTVKLMLHRGHVFPARGGHRARPGGGVRYLTGVPLSALPQMEDPARRMAWPFRVDHYKWTAGRLPKQRLRLETPGALPEAAANGMRIAEYLQAHGRIRLEDVAVRQTPPPESPPWRRQAAMARLRAALRLL